MNILLTFGWGLGNIGDVAISKGMLDTLERRYPGSAINIVSMYPAGGGEYEAFKAYTMKHNPHCVVWPNPFQEFISADEVTSWLTTSAAVHDTARFLRRLFRIDPAFGRMFMTTDLLFMNSGMMLSFNRLGEPGALGFLISLWLPMILANRLGIPYVAWGQSCSQFDEPARELARNLLKESLYVTTRETESLAFVREVTGGLEQSAFAPDTTVEFNAPDEAFAASFMGQHGLKDRGFVVFIIRTTAWWNRPVEGERLRRHMRLIASGIEYCVKKLGLRAVVAPECEREISIATEHLASCLPGDVRQQTLFMDHFWLPEEAQGLYRHAFALSSMELHSILLSVPMGTPVIHTWFEEMGPKTFAVRDFGLGDFLLNIDEGTPESYCCLFQRIWDDESGVRELVRHGAESFHQALEDGMTEVQRRYSQLPVAGLRHF